MSGTHLNRLFHPAVATWFERSFATPSSAQEQGWPAIGRGEHTLIAAPTGSGKTLAAFLSAIDRLFRLAEVGDLPDRVKVVYVSPLRALSNDIHRNLSMPLAGIQAVFEELQQESQAEVPVVRAGLRTGDTSPSQRRKLVLHPPHILVTTPESLQLLVTSKSGRAMLAEVDTLIVDEIHALAANRRGAALALTVARLEALTSNRLQRIGLSATQRPLSLVADYLVGVGKPGQPEQPSCTIVDEGHVRKIDLAIQLPGSPLEAVMSHEIWADLYDQLVALIEAHETTIIFVNQRNMSERLTRKLSDRLPEHAVAAHHGSLPARVREQAEQALKNGELKAIVATASLELGIDVGHVSLVVQVGSSRSIANVLQRVGRSGHFRGGVPKGRLFPLTRDELLEAAALLRAIRQGELDTLIIPEQPLDVLSQHIVAACACRDWEVRELYDRLTTAYAYRQLSFEAFEQVVYMLADGIATQKGKRGAHLYYDAVNGRLRGRKGARLAALTGGGAIPDNADYDVVLEPSGLKVGRLDEDYAIESSPGDVFQLGNHSWMIVKVESGQVRVHDAEGAPPSIPFWFGEGPSRTIELSQAVSRMRTELAERIQEPERLRAWCRDEIGLSTAGADQLRDFVATTQTVLGVVPTQEDLVMERFFDDSGGMQLVIHSPFGSRLNRAWGLALRKRFCRSFNFELQAAANEDAIVISLSEKHSFPLEDVFRFLNPTTVREVLTQAVLDSPMFQTRWRWNAFRSLALLRQRGGKRVPPHIQRMMAEDLIAAVFPDQLACLENIVGEREVPDHPLVGQTLTDCLDENMDCAGLQDLLARITHGKVRTHAVDVTEPSPMSHGILTAGPYAFLDDAPLEERRTRAVQLRRGLSPEMAREAGFLDDAAIATVLAQAQPVAEHEDDVHELIQLFGGLSREEVTTHQPAELLQRALSKLQAQGRIGWFRPSPQTAQTELWIAAESLPAWQALFPMGQAQAGLVPPKRDRARQWSPEEACTELIRGRLEVCGPITVASLAATMGLPVVMVETACLAMENQGIVLRGHFLREEEAQQWCNRHLLARIHRLTLQRLRAEIRPVTAHQFVRFLFHWQRVDAESQAEGVDGLEEVIHLLQGFPAGAQAWEGHLLPARVKSYQPSMLDQLCLAGSVTWGRAGRPQGNSETGKASRSGTLKTTPISLYLREDAEYWRGGSGQQPLLSGYALQVLEQCREKGALFFAQLVEGCRLLPTQIEQALGELVAAGLVNSDSFAGLRALINPAKSKLPSRASRRWRSRERNDIALAGRWSLVPHQSTEAEEEEQWHPEQVALIVTCLLRRYGVVFRKVLQHESGLPPWRLLLGELRRREMSGLIRGGYFVEGCGGEHFALPEAIGLLRRIRKQQDKLGVTVLNACDPLNLTGSIIPGEVVPRQSYIRIVFHDGLPQAVVRKDGLTYIHHPDPAPQEAIHRALGMASLHRRVVR